MSGHACSRRTYYESTRAYHLESLGEQDEKKTSWTTKHILGGFCALRDKVNRDTSEARHKRERTFRQEQVRKTLAQRALDLLHTQDTGQIDLCAKIKSSINLVNPLPHAFMNSGNEDPRHTAKSQTMALFQNIAGFGTDNSEPLFLIDGYPNIEGDHIVVAVDAMNYIHNDVDHTYSLTIRLHIDAIASRILRAIPFSAREKAILMDIHFDDYERVPSFKKGEQLRRDNIRGREEDNVVIPQVSALINIDNALPKDWKETVLANKAEKRALVNIIAENLLIVTSRCACSSQITGDVPYPVRVFGGACSISRNVLAIPIDLNDLCLGLLPSGEPVVLLETEIDNEGLNVSENLYKFLSTSFIVVRSTSMCNDFEIQDGHTQNLNYAVITEDVDARSGVGEGEIRTQSQLHFLSESLPSTLTSVSALQISADTDNIALALMALSEEKFSKYRRVLVKLPTRFAVIKQLKRCLNSISLHYLVFARLYCLIGNEFCCRCAIATGTVIFATYLQYRDLIGNFCENESTLKLYYLYFLTKRSFTVQMFSDTSIFWSAEWKQEARKAIAFHNNTRSTIHLLPQDEDLQLQHNRMTWNVSEYWSQCTERDVQFFWQNAEDWGFQTN